MISRKRTDGDNRPLEGFWDRAYARNSPSIYTKAPSPFSPGLNRGVVVGGRDPAASCRLPRSITSCVSRAARLVTLALRTSACVVCLVGDCVLAVQRSGGQRSVRFDLACLPAAYGMGV